MMNPVDGCITRCVRHPSQNFTGFCSSCLVERLSCIDAAVRSPKCPSEQIEVDDAYFSPKDFVQKPPEIRARRTLQSLFRLDDAGDSERHGVEEANDSWAENLVTADMLFQGNTHVHASVALPEGNCSRDSQVGTSFNTEARLSEKMAAAENSGSTSYGVLEESNDDPCADKKVGPLDSESFKDKGVSVWLGSLFPRNVLKWRTRSIRRKNLPDQRCRSGAVEEEWLENGHKFCHSCDCKVSYESSKGSWEDPRHSWDGSMMSRAFACSFSCVEEAEDRNLEDLWDSDNPGLPTTGKKKESIHGFSEAMSSHSRKPTKRNSSTTYHVGSTVGRAQSNTTRPQTERFNEEYKPNGSIPKISKRKPCMWSKGWSWSITSPFREISQNQQHFYERSLSESWREDGRMKSVEKVNSDSEHHLHGSDVSRVSHNLNRNKNMPTGDLHGLRSDWQTKKREHKFGRSRSVHFYSPGNLDNGLLRFYLTPLRTSRRSTNRSRMNMPHSFRQGLAFHGQEQF